MLRGAMIACTWLVLSQQVLLSYDDDGEVASRNLSNAERLRTNNRVPSDPGAWQDFARSDCGANACFVLLRLHGLPLRPEDVSRFLPSRSGGSSLLDLKSAAGKFGAGCEAIRCDFAQLKEQKLPLIARLGSVTEPQAGHFVVLTALDDKNVSYVDGTTMMSVQRSSGSFSREYSGHALVISTAPVGANQRNLRAWHPLTYVLVTVIICELFAMLGVIALRFRR